MSCLNCCFLTCIQVSQEAGQVVWYSHLFQNFPQFLAIHTVKGLGIVNKAEVDVFPELSCFFDDSMYVGNLISGSSAFFKSSLNIWKFTVHILLKPGLENFEHYFTSMWDECNCVVVWAFFAIAFLWDWNENWPFPVLWPLLSFPNLLAYWVQHFHSIIFQDLKYLNWNSITSTSFVCSDPKAHLTSHSRMSGSRGVITPLWLCRSWRSLWYISSMYSCYLFLISSASVTSIPFLSFVEPIFAWNVPLVSLMFLKRSLVFPILTLELQAVATRHWSSELCSAGVTIWYN